MSGYPCLPMYLLSFMAQVQQTKILSKVGDTDENDLEMKNNLLKTTYIKYISNFYGILVISLISPLQAATLIEAEVTQDN